MNKKFDVVIGNPPYQEERTGDSTNQMPIYHLFMEAAYAVGTKVVLITPARFLFDAGYTPKAWNEKMLSDPHLKVPFYTSNSDKLFPGTDIKGGVAVTYRDESRAGEPIGTFTKHPELQAITQKVDEITDGSLVSLGITNDRVYRYTKSMHDENPHMRDLMSGNNHFKLDSRAFTRLAPLYFTDPPTDDKAYRRVLGLGEKKRRSFRWIRSDYVTGPDALEKYKVALPKTNGTGEFGEKLAPPMVLEAGAAVTDTFITIGAFDTESQAEACLKYLKSKFARAMLGVKKVTQDNLARVWAHVPLQDFTAESDIDWTKPIPEIDRQLYAKYGLDTDEIDFIETKVKPMD